MSKRILIMAGGTGGHVFPGLAVANLLREEDWHVHWLGTAQRMEAEIVPKQGIEISFIDVAGVRGNGLLRLLAAPFKIIKSVFQAIKVLREVKPDVVLGMGGFASGPGGVAAWLMNKPLVLHEQNAVPGLTNKLLSKIASSTLQAFAGTFADSRAKTVGNPVRQDVLALTAPEQRINTTDKVRLLVVGGSLGAIALNQHVPEAVSQVARDGQLSILHQAGKGKAEEVIESYKQLGIEADVREFIDDMAEAYASADLVICRAGALTVSELAAAGLGSVFVPLPHAVDDHQTKNAQVLVKAGAAKLLPQTELAKGKLADVLQQLIADKMSLLTMAETARECAVGDATIQVAAECRYLAKEKD